MTLNYWTMVKRYLNLKEEVGGSIPNCKISSLLDKTNLPGGQLPPMLRHSIPPTHKAKLPVLTNNKRGTDLENQTPQTSTHVKESHNKFFLPRLTKLRLETAFSNVCVCGVSTQAVGSLYGPPTKLTGTCRCRSALAEDTSRDGKLLGCQRKPKLLTLLTYFTCGEEEGWSASKVEVTESWVLLIIISGDESRKDKALIIVVIIITLLRLLPLP
jgi:hypothetical protein